jgi:transposase
MYIRTATRHNKNGTVARYVQLAHNVWDPKAKRSGPRIIYSFGREEEVDKEALRRLVRSINHFLGPEEALRAEAEGKNKAGLRFIGSQSLGGAWVLDRLWEKLGIGQALARLLRERRYRTPVERSLFALVANRALSPSSKLEVEEWVAEEVVIPGLEEVPVQQLYRAMDFLLEHQEEVQWQVFTAVADLLNLEVDILFFDTTSVYFEVEDEDEGEEGSDGGLRRRGHSRDHRPDLPQALIGLAVTREGIPVRCWVWPGNTADMAVVPEVKKDLVGWKLGRVITVVDRGFVSEDNLRELQRSGGHYIAGERLRSGKAGVEAALERPGRYQKVREGVEVKEIVVGEGEARQRYVRVRNPKRMERDRAQRQELLERLQEALKGLGELKGAVHSRACCALLSHPTYGRYLKLDRHGQPHIDRRKVAEEARLDGKYLLRTSDDTLSAADVALGYKQLAEVEQAFRCLKHELELRPMYHRLEERIRAHVLLCWLALLLMRVAENRTEETWRKMRPKLERMHLGEYRGPDGRVLRRTETTHYQQGLFKALGIPEPPHFHLIEVSAAQTLP